MNYLKIDRQVVCKMAMLLAFMFAACSEDGKSIADGGTAEETGIYALKNITVAGKVGDLVPMTFVAMKDNGDTLQKSNLVLDSLDEAIVTIYELDSTTLDTTGRFFTDTVRGASGDFSFDSISLKSPYVLVEVLDSCYTPNCIEKSEPNIAATILEDLDSTGTGKLNKFPRLLKAIVDIQQSGNISVNMLTDMKVQRLRELVAAGTSFAVANKQAESEILEEYGVYEDLGSFESLKNGTESELAFVRLLILSGESEGWRMGDEYEWYRLASSKAFAALGEKVKEKYQNVVKLFEYKVGYLAHSYGLGKCTEQREDEVVLKEGISFVCRSGKWDMGYKKISYTRGTMTDDRDGKTYNTVTYTINGKQQTWMSENLNFADTTSASIDSALKAHLMKNTSTFGNDVSGDVNGRYYVWFAGANIGKNEVDVYRIEPQGDTTILDKRCGGPEINCIDAADNSICQEWEENVTTYCAPLIGDVSLDGWDWNHEKFIPQSKPLQGVCPDGWRIPNIDDWISLVEYVANEYNIEISDVGTMLADDVATGFGLKPVIRVRGDENHLRIGGTGYGYQFMSIPDFQSDEKKSSYGVHFSRITDRVKMPKIALGYDLNVIDFAILYNLQQLNGTFLVRCVKN